MIPLSGDSTDQHVERLWPHPDGRTLVAQTGYHSATFTWWDVAAGERVRAARRPNRPEIMLTPAFAPDHSWCAVGRELWSETAPVQFPLRGYGRNPVYDPYIGFTFTPDGATLFGARKYHKKFAPPEPTLFGFRLPRLKAADPWAVDRWALTPAGPVPKPPVFVGDHGAEELAVSLDGRTLFALAYWHGLSRFALPGGETLPQLAEWDSTDGCDSLQISPDGETLVLLAQVGVKLLDPHFPGPPRAVLPGPSRAAAFTPDSRRLVTAALDGTTAVWDVATGECVVRYDWSPVAGFLYSVAVAPDGLTAYAGGSDGRVVRWDLPD